MGLKLSNGLTIKQDEFVRALVSGMSQTQAAIAAGYAPSGAPNMATKFMLMPEVLAEIERLRVPGLEAAIRKAEINAEWVYDGIRQVREEGLRMVPILSRGEIVGEKPQDLAAAARATELGAKLLGMMIERQSIELSGEARRVLEEVIQAVVAEVEDPAVRERIMARLAGEGLGVASQLN